MFLHCIQSAKQAKKQAVTRRKRQRRRSGAAPPAIAYCIQSDYIIMLYSRAAFIVCCLPPRSAVKRKAPPAIGRKRAAPPEEEKRPRTPSARPADSSLESPGGRETRSAAPAPAGPRERETRLFLNLAGRERKRPREEPRENLDPLRRSRNRKAGRRERTCRPSPSPAHIAKRPAVTTSRTTWTTATTTAMDPAQHRNRPPSSRRDHLKKAPPLLNLNHRAIAPHHQQHQPPTWAHRHNADTMQTPAPSPRHPGNLRRDFLQISTPTTGNTTATKKQGKGKGRGGTIGGRGNRN